MPSSSPSSDLCLSAYHYDLPPDRIAQYPLPQRDQARMLTLNRHTGGVAHQQIESILDFLNPGDCMVVNNTRVLQSRFRGHRQGYTGQVEVLLLQPVENNETNAGQEDWYALMKPTRKLAVGMRIELPNAPATLEVLVLGQGTRGQVRVHLNGAVPDVMNLMKTLGEVPIPPYLGRAVEEADKTTYQTVYSDSDAPLLGSQAAPTAGLHFTPELLARIEAKGVRIAPVTLSVSTGTFRSVQTEDITLHRMDPEQYHISEDSARMIQQTRDSGGKVLAVGTTSCKTLETVANLNNRKIVPTSGWSQLFIYPGFQFQVADLLLTNFHLPATTLMMLVSAFASRPTVLKAYEEAVQQNYRFFSYGDCMLLY